MKTLVNRAGNGIKEMAVMLADFPAPEKWSQEQKAQAIQFAALLDSAQKMIAAASLAGINYQKEKKTFLDNAGKTKSPHTRIAYQSALNRLETWVSTKGINILELRPSQADDFIYFLRNDRKSASVRLDTAAASSFFTWLHRRHNAVENPFRGTKARPVKEAVREIEIPTAQEVETIINELPSDLSAAVAVMAYRGFRAGIFPTLKITGNKFTGQSKGKYVSGALSLEILNAIKKAGLPLRKPFDGIKANTLEKRIARAIVKLYETGKVQAKYSCHDFRHFFAVAEYQKDRDIRRVSKLLGHTSISVTENYLKALGEVE